MLMSKRDFVYCPFCGLPLEPRQVMHQVRPGCPQCGFVHFHNPKVAVIGQLELDGRMLLVRRGINPGKGLWALPGGYMDAGEMPDEALRRELREELGVDVQVHELLAVYPMVTRTNGDETSQGIVLAYRAALIDPASEPIAQDDVAEVRWYGAAELPTDLAFASTRDQLRRWQQNQTES
jgi:ADP-ribose pyrophosphatase YjhB (NUDIX family)